MTVHAALRVDDATHAGSARRVAATMAERYGFDATAAGKVALVVTEVATNLVKHGGGGELLLYSIVDDGSSALGVLGLDRGPGIANLAECLRDGFTTSGTPGTGLGAIDRLATRFEVYSGRAGTAIFALVSNAPAASRPRGGPMVGGVSVALRGEDTCGDGWAIVSGGARLMVLVVDGLGHGEGAAEAARAAIAIFRAHASNASPAELMERFHDGLRGTRGAAASVAELDRERRIARFAGVGNVAGAVVANGRLRSMVSHHGTLGHTVRKMSEFSYPWPERSTVVLHSDGVGTKWNIDAYPGLIERDPMLIAGVLYRDFRRERDDATVVAVREAV